MSGSKTSVAMLAGAVLILSSGGIGGQHPAGSAVGTRLAASAQTAPVLPLAPVGTAVGTRTNTSAQIAPLSPLTPSGTAVGTRPDTSAQTAPSMALTPAGGAAGTRPAASAQTAPLLPPTPADMPPSPPKVICDGGNLTISAQNSTLAAVLNAVRDCTGATIDVPEDARSERLFAELGPGPVRAVLADFLSSTDFNYVIEASPSNPLKVQAVVLNPRVNDSTALATAEVLKDSTLSANRRGWLEARRNYQQSFVAQDAESNVGANDAPPASPPVDTATAPTNSNPPEADPAGAAPAMPAEPVPVTNGTPAAVAESGANPTEGKTTQEMISNMQRLFEQRKQMVQQQQQLQQKEQTVTPK